MDKDTKARAMILLSKKDNEYIVKYIKELLQDRFREWINITGETAIHRQQGKIQELDSLIKTIEKARKDHE